jgi:uncharacterized RDD family membrane protein YckC
MSDQPPPPPPPPSAPPPGQPGPGPAPQLDPVGPWPRLGARIIDGLVLFIPNLIIAAVLTDGDGGGFGGLASSGDLLYLLVTTLVGFGYAVWLEASRGQTVGKMAVGIKVIGPDGRVPATDVAARRNAWLLLSLVPVLGGIVSLVVAIAIGVTINSDPFKRGVHDNFAGGSAVVRAR